MGGVARGRKLRSAGASGMMTEAKAQATLVYELAMKHCTGTYD